MKKIEIDRKKLIDFISLGVSKSKIAKHLSISESTLYRYLKENPINTEIEINQESDKSDHVNLSHMTVEERRKYYSSLSNAVEHILGEDEL